MLHFYDGMSHGAVRVVLITIRQAHTLTLSVKLKKLLVLSTILAQHVVLSSSFLLSGVNTMRKLNIFFFIQTAVCVIQRSP